MAEVKQLNAKGGKFWLVLMASHSADVKPRADEAAKGAIGKDGAKAMTSRKRYAMGADQKVKQGHFRYGTKEKLQAVCKALTSSLVAIDGQG